MKFGFNLIGAALNSEEIQEQAEKIEEITQPDFWAKIDWSALLKPLALGLVTFVVGYYIIRILIRFLDKILKQQGVNRGLTHFLLVGLKGILYFFLVTIVAGNLGIKTNSLVALIGTLGIAIGLALQGSLSDLASGILLVLVQPFQVGDFISIQDREGLYRVFEIRLFQTILVDYKGFHYILPNKTMMSSALVNLSQEPLVGAQVQVVVDMDQDIDRVMEVARTALEGVDLLNHDRGYSIFLDELLDYGMSFVFRGFTQDVNYASACTDIAVAIKKAFDREGIRLAHKIVRIEERKDWEN